ncbi:MAG TPA: DUF6788 family protein [Kineosporiaceae bacterium]|jgi:hypothetical protein|nr:DUF6788 family protein [Kineosporiaceae bacterium]
MSPRSRRSEGAFLRGTLTTFRRRCGKPSCYCATGEPHASPALAYTEGGRTKTLTLADTEVAEVAAGLARFEKARAELERAADAGIAALRARRGR